MPSEDIQDLVENPREDLEVELKEWVDLSDNLSRAKLARHICALANNGGGYLVFGFRDDLTPSEDVPEDFSAYSRDTFSGIVGRYLAPRFQCEVNLVELSDAGRKHPVVWVPSHGRVPICAIASGPHDSRGHPQGIREGRHYTRAPGPASVPINEESLWVPVIRRCVLNDAEGLLASLRRVMNVDQLDERDSNDWLKIWHERSHERFVTLFESAHDLTWPVPYLENHYELSYSIEGAAEEEVPAGQLAALLNEANRETRDMVWTGWSMFYPFTRPGSEPYLLEDTLEDQTFEVCESSLLSGEHMITLPDFWRVTPGGMASLVRGYREDRSSYTDRSQPLLPGEWLSPFTLIREISELVRHSKAMARNFPSAQTVAFRCSWWGLEGRRLDGFENDFDIDVRISRGGTRTTSGIFSIETVSAEWPEVVAALANPVLRLFGGYEVSAQWIAGQAPRFRS